MGKSAYVSPRRQFSQGEAKAICDILYDYRRQEISPGDYIVQIGFNNGYGQTHIHQMVVGQDTLRISKNQVVYAKFSKIAHLFTDYSEIEPCERETDDICRMNLRFGQLDLIAEGQKEQIRFFQSKVPILYEGIHVYDLEFSSGRSALGFGVCIRQTDLDNFLGYLYHYFGFKHLVYPEQKGKALTSLELLDVKAKEFSKEKLPVGSFLDYCNNYQPQDIQRLVQSAMEEYNPIKKKS